MSRNETTGPWGLTIEELCRLCDLSPQAAARAIENLRPRKTATTEQNLRDLFASEEDYEHYVRMREENQNG